MIKFKSIDGEFKISDEFEISGTNDTWVRILKTFVDIVSEDFHPDSGDPFLILEDELKKMGFEILEITTTYNPEDTY